MTGIQAYLIVVGVMSAVTFITYGLDKGRARRGGRRVPEATLHLMALAGGWPGAIAGARLLRHKTRKAGFNLVTAAISIVHLAGAAWLIHLSAR
jgi:uncharacterized membrane protein YsdA (DUF1294 family)